MIEWTVPARLVTSIGTLYFNDPTPPGTFQDGYYPLVEAECKAEKTLRTATDKIPQADGEIFHRRFSDATEFTIAVQLWENEQEPACDAVLRSMYEQLVASLNALINNPGRFIWQPSGYSDERMLEACRYSDPIAITWAQGVPTATFKLDSPFPYVIDKTQVDDPPGNLSLGGSAAFHVPADTPTNIVMPAWSANFWPVIELNGPINASTITNADVTDEYGVPLKIRYDGDLPPGTGFVDPGDWVEIITFHQTAYKNGNLANMKPYIDPEITDFFYLQPGDNHITVTVTDADFLINYAWAVA